MAIYAVRVRLCASLCLSVPLQASWTMFIVFECQNMQASRGKFAGPWNSANIHCFLHTRVRFREDLAQETQGVEIQVRSLSLSLSAALPLCLSRCPFVSLYLTLCHCRSGDPHWRYLPGQLVAYACDVDEFVRALGGEQQDH